MHTQKSIYLQKNDRIERLSLSLFFFLSLSLLCVAHCIVCVAKKGLMAELYKRIRATNVRSCAGIRDRAEAEEEEERSEEWDPTPTPTPTPTAEAEEEEEV